MCRFSKKRKEKTETETETVEKKYEALKLDDKAFDVSNSSRDDYEEFIQSFNSEYFGASLECGTGDDICRPFLRNQTDDGFRFFEVELIASEGLEAPVRVKFRFSASNLYLFGFHIGEKQGNKELWYQLEGWGIQKNIDLLSMTTLSPITTVEYSNLGNRIGLKLGKHHLEKGLVKLSKYQNGKKWI